MGREQRKALACAFLRAVSLPFGHTPNHFCGESCTSAIKKVLIDTHSLAPILLTPASNEPGPSVCVHHIMPTHIVSVAKWEGHPL